MTRVSDWQVRLAEYLESELDVPHEWGGSDCCDYSGGGVDAMTGKNPMDKFTVQYSDEKTGRALLERYGGLARILTDLYGRSRQHGTRGDLAYSVFPDGSAVGICTGDKALFKGEDGIVEVELSECRFFKVP